MPRYIEEDANGNRYIVDDGSQGDFGGGSSQSLPFAHDTQIGPDYNQSLIGNFGQGIMDAPEAAVNLAGDAFNVVSPYTSEGWQIPIVDPVINAGVEKTARTVGGLAAGTAGAASLGPWAAGWGGTLAGPWGALAGGVLGGATGFGAGMLGFDVTTDVASTGFSGAWGDGTDYIRPTDEYLKDFAYNTGQGTALGGAAEAALRAPGIRQIKEPFSRSGAERKVYEKLNEMSPGYAEAIDRASAPYGDPSIQGPVQDPFQQFKSLGELIDSDVLKNAERTINRTSPEGYGKATEQYRARNDAQLKWLDQIEKSDVTLGDAQSAIQKGLDDTLAAANRDVATGEGIVKDLTSGLPEKSDVSNLGREIRDNNLAAREAERANSQNFFKGIGEGQVDVAPVYQRAQSYLSDYFREVGAQPSGELSKLIADLNKQAEPSGLFDAQGQPITKTAGYTMKDLQALRSEALRIGQEGDPRSARIANDIAENLKTIGDMAVQAGTVKPQEAANWKAGIEAYRKMNDKFGSSALPSKKVLSQEGFGRYTLPESAVPGQFFKAGERGAKEAVRNYKETIGDSEAALEPLYRYAVDSFKDAAVKGDGLVDSRAANAWLRRHSSALEELPELKRELSDITSAQQLLNETYGDLKRTQAEVEKGTLRSFLNADPEKAIGSMLSGKDMARRTKATVDYLKGKDPDALAGLRRGVIEHLKKKAFIDDAKVSLEEASQAGGRQFDGTVRGGLLKSEWEKIRPAIEKSKLFTDSQMQGFDYLYRDKSSQLSVEKSKMPGGSDTFQNSSVFVNLTKIAGNSFLKGMPGSRFIASVVAPFLRALPEGHFLAAMEEALLNPRYARELAYKATPKNVANSFNIIFGQRMKPGSTLGEVAETAAKIGAPYSPITQNEGKKKIQIPKQQSIISKQSFPEPQDLLSPPQGKAEKAFNVKDYLSQQDPETKARIGVESNGNPESISPKGAQGLSQLMPETAQEIAFELGETYTPLRPNMTPEERQASIEQNVRFGDYYYKKMFRKYNNKSLAWAAYNAGPGRVDDAIAMAGTSRDINKVMSNLPLETRGYVRKLTQKVGA